MHQADPEWRVIKPKADEADRQRQYEDRDREGSRQQDQKAVGGRARENKASERNLPARQVGSRTLCKHRCLNTV